MHTKTLIFISVTAMLVYIARAEYSIASSTANWTPIVYRASTPDPAHDQQTGGKEGDLVGDQDNPSFYTTFYNGGTSAKNDGLIAFRARLNRVKNEKKKTFDDVLLVGIDANQDAMLDIFLGMNKKGNITMWNPGAGLNTSPSTTSIASKPVITYEAAIGINYHFAPVTYELDPTATTLDIDGEGYTDWFLSFSFDFATLTSQLAINGIDGITEDSPFAYILATSTQDNALNMDLNGINGAPVEDQTWASLGATSSPAIIVTGEIIPEPNAISLLLSGVFCILLVRRNQSPPLVNNAENAEIRKLH